jgi:hypothetical protein
MGISNILLIVVSIIAIIVYSVQSARLLALKQKIKNNMSTRKYQVIPIRKQNDEAIILGYKVVCYVNINESKGYSPDNWRKIYDSLLDHPLFKTRDEAIIIGLKYFIVKNYKLYEEYFDDSGVCNLVR